MDLPAAAEPLKTPEKGRLIWPLTGSAQYMNMDSGPYMKRPLLIGFLLWMAGTILLRFAGHGFLRPGRPLHTIIFYLVSFLLMAVLIPGICRRLKFTGDSRFQGVALLLLPTLLLDPFTSAFFANVFPNLDPAAAGVFGGWILICCAGAVAGVCVSEGATLASATNQQK